MSNKPEYELPIPCVTNTKEELEKKGYKVIREGVKNNEPMAFEGHQRTGTYNNEPVWKVKDESEVEELFIAKEMSCQHIRVGAINIGDRLIETIMMARPEERDYVNTAYYHGPAPRYSMAFGRSYRFAGVNHEAQVIPGCLKGLMGWARQFAPFNGILINWYENGLDYIGRHKDDEKSLVAGEPILTLSIGATRKFRVRDNEGNIVQDFEMHNGSFLVMKHPFQERYTHEIVKVSGDKGLKVKPRASLTFRVFK